LFVIHQVSLDLEVLILVGKDVRLELIHFSCLSISIVVQRGSSLFVLGSHVWCVLRVTVKFVQLSLLSSLLVEVWVSSLFFLTHLSSKILSFSVSVVLLLFLVTIHVTLTVITLTENLSLGLVWPWTGKDIGLPFLIQSRDAMSLSLIGLCVIIVQKDIRFFVGVGLSQSPVPLHWGILNSFSSILVVEDV